MKRTCFASPGSVMITIMAIMVCVPGLVHADQNITQTFELKIGWNSLFTEVRPVVNDPDTLFEGTPIKKALTYYPENSPLQFIQDPDEAPWDKYGWSRWLPRGKRDAFIKNLFTIQPNQAYLLYCTEDYTLRLTGTPELKKQNWQPHAFNFVGFHVDETAPPTFFQFFEGSSAHSAFHIYYLHDNKWMRVKAPSGMNIASGQAYWVWCKGGSDHQGPMEVSLPGTGDELNFLPGVSELEIEVTNQAPNPLTFTLEPVSGNQVPLSLVKSVITEDTVVTYERFTSYSPEISLEPGETHNIRLAVYRREITADEVTGLLKLTDDIGNRVYIKVRAEKI